MKMDDSKFDVLARKANESGGAMEALNELFGAVFALERWEFISRGEMPNPHPYIASHSTVADNQPMIRAFTDSKRLIRFAKENNLTDADGSCKSLTIPTANITEYLEGFIEQGAHGVWFNSDTQSDGFFIPLKQLRPIKEHLAKINGQKINEQQSKIDQVPAAKTLIVQIKDGLGFPSGFVKEADYTCHIFCRVPESWIDGEQLKPEYLEKIYEQFYGANWRMGNSDGSQYVVRDCYVKILPPGMIKNIQWTGTVNDDKNHYWWYIASASGAVRSVKEEEFGADINAAEVQTPVKTEETPAPSNLQNLGLSQSSGGEIDLNLTVNKAGAVHFETSIAPFYEAVVPLLEDYRGVGEYVSLLRFEPDGKSVEVENIAENSHGAYLQIRRFLYLNPKNIVRIGVNSIHSKSLRHVLTNSELLVSVELCKNLDNQTAVFYHAFQGPKDEVLKLSAAIQPILESFDYRDAGEQ